MQNQTTDWTEIASRCINAIVVIVAIGFVVLVLSWLRQWNQTQYTNISTLFGALTTFIGTAIGAYFGISVSATTAKTAVNAVSSTAADASQKLGATSQQLATTQQQLAVSQKQVTAAGSILSNLDTSDPTHVAQLDQARAILQST